MNKLEKCNDTDHHYYTLKEDYYKHDGSEGSFGPRYDHSIAYSTLCCRKCGKIKEVISADHRKEEG